MSIFFICIIASNARLAAAGSGSVIARHEVQHNLYRSGANAKWPLRPPLRIIAQAGANDSARLRPRAPTAGGQAAQLLMPPNTRTLARHEHSHGGAPAREPQ